MLDLMGKGITVVLTLGITASAWAAPSLPGSSDDVRALEQNRGARQQQTDLQQTDLQQPEQQKQLKKRCRRNYCCGNLSLQASRK